MDALIGPGVHRGIDEDYYHALPYYSASAVRSCRNNSRNLRDSLAKRHQKPTQAMEFGKAFHANLLEPGRFSEQFDILPEGLNFRTSEGKALKAGAEENGKAIIKEQDLQTINAMKESLMSHKYMEDYFDIDKADIELTVINEVEGCIVKSRLDSYFHHDGGVIIDLKTTMDATESGWRKTLRYDKYMFQAAIYLNMLRLQGLPANAFYFAAVEKSPPYTCGVYGLSEETIESVWNISKGLLRECGAATDWLDLPHYNTEPTIFHYDFGGVSL